MHGHVASGGPVDGADGVDDGAGGLDRAQGSAQIGGDGARGQNGRDGGLDGIRFVLQIEAVALSGAEPWIGSNRPGPSAPRDAEGSRPMEPPSTEISSDRMSPNMFSVRMTS